MPDGIRTPGVRTEDVHGLYASMCACALLVAHKLIRHSHQCACLLKGSLIMQNSSGSTQSHGEVSSPGDDEVVLQLKLGEPEVQIRLTRGDVRTASLKRMASIWKTLVQKIGVCLPEASRDPNSILAQRITVSLHTFFLSLPVLLSLNLHGLARLQHTKL